MEHIEVTKSEVNSPATCWESVAHKWNKATKMMSEAPVVAAKMMSEALVIAYK